MRCAWKLESGPSSQTKVNEVIKIKLQGKFNVFHV